MALSRSERNALRAAKGQSTRGKVSTAPVSATGVTGTTYKANQPKPVEQKAIEQIVEVQKPTYDPTQDIQALAEARKKTQLAGLESRMQQGKSDIAERRANIPQQYREQRRQAGVQSKMAAKNFSEFLAQRGLARSGESAQAKLMQQSALQGQLGSIGRQEQSALDTLGRDEQRLQQQYLSDIGAIESGIGADTMQQMINARTQQEALQRQDRLRQEDIARQDMLRNLGYQRQDELRGQDIEREDLLRQQQLGLRAEDLARQEAIRQQELAREQERYTSEQQFREQEANRDYDIALQRLGIDSRGLDLREKQALYEQEIGRGTLQERIRSAQAEEALRGRGLDLEQQKESRMSTTKQKEDKPIFSNTEAEKMLDTMTYTDEMMNEVGDKPKQIDWVMQAFLDGKINEETLEYLNIRKNLGIDENLQRRWMQTGSASEASTMNMNLLPYYNQQLGG